MKLRRSFLRFFLGFLLLSFAPSSMPRFVVEKNSLRVTLPDSMEVAWLGMLCSLRITRRLVKSSMSLASSSNRSLELFPQSFYSIVEGQKLASSACPLSSLLHRRNKHHAPLSYLFTND